MRVVVVFSNIRQDTIRLQPGRYVSEIISHLQKTGHPTTLITDTGPDAPDPSSLGGAEVQTLKSNKVYKYWENRDLKTKVLTIKPDVLLWGIGQSSFWHLAWPGWINCPLVGLFTSPIYSPREITRLGFKEIWDYPKFYAFYLISAFAPDHLSRRVINHPVLSRVIVLSQDVKSRLEAKGINSKKIRVIPPGVDSRILSDTSPAEMSGGTADGVKALYLGSPELYRGPDIAIRAIAQLRREGISIRLVILSRSINGQFDLEERNLHNLVAELGLGDQVFIISGFLPNSEITRHMRQTDLILLPFKLVPSDMPLTVIEAMQIGKPIIASSIGSIAELLANGRGSLVTPNRSDELADAIKVLAESPGSQNALGKSAMDYIQTWPSWDYSCHQVEKLMVEVLSDHKSHD